MLSASAQSGLYEPKEIKRAYESGTRSRDGLPGRDYWQNSANYDLSVELEPQSKLLKGEGTIRYQNNSPDSLRYLVVKLLPNIQKKGSARDYPASPESITDGLAIDTISINGRAWDLNNKQEAIIYGTNLYLIFSPAEKVPPGGVTEIFMVWSYEVPLHSIRNGAYTDSSFFIGYWYPQMAVYDDVFGWDREEYTGLQETYNDTGSYHVEIHLPYDYLVWATGDQLNEDDVFSDRILERIKSSRNSVSTVNIIKEEDYVTGEVLGDKHSGTWVFEARGVTDFAWACSNYYLWDANSVELKNTSRNVWVNAVYPPDNKAFNKVADVAHAGIKYCSEVFPGVPYPFNKHITYNGINYVGVEYPMMANNGDHNSEEMYSELTVHEIAHNYIPFFMLSNERRHAWIDEGWVKLIGELHGESIGFKRENKEQLNTVKIYERFAGTSDDLPLIVPSGSMTTTHNFYHSYAKSSNSNLFLLELMREKGVQNPLKDFLLAWHGKHPTPYDFFNYMNTLCGSDLSWFWKPWYFEFCSPDLAIKEGEEAGQLIVYNPGGIPLPIRIELTYENGDVEIIEKSIWEWSLNPDGVVLDIPGYDKLSKVTLGSKRIPEINRENNTL
jgi:hypothetical protein